MIRHIFKIVWNERKINFWLLMEYILIFCILWFCCDYIYNMTKNYLSPIGYDISDTYIIRMAEKPTEEKYSRDDHYDMVMTVLDRIKKHPEVEYVTSINGGAPYSMSRNSTGVFVNNDSIRIGVRTRDVTSEFFDVYKIKMEEGRIFDWKDDAEYDNVVVSPSKDGYFGDREDPAHAYLMSEVHTLRYSLNNKRKPLSVIGITDKKRDAYWQPFESSIISPMQRRTVSVWNEIAVRVKPGTKEGFPQRFIKDMRGQLYIGSYFLWSVTSTEDAKEQAANYLGVKGKINSTSAITAFLVVNIFLGVLGSFWFRTQSRRSEIGLRMAMGASKRNVQGMFISETLLLLSIASIIATFICLHLAGGEFIEKLGIPKIDRKQWGIGYEQDVINFAITFVFLTIVSVIAVWYPAKQASDTQPAEVLRDE